MFVLALITTKNDNALAQGWLGFVYMSHAVIDKQSSWQEVNTLTAFDDGNSKTNTLYWVATRP